MGAREIPIRIPRKTSPEPRKLCRFEKGDRPTFIGGRKRGAVPGRDIYTKHAIWEALQSAQSLRFFSTKSRFGTGNLERCKMLI